MLFNFFRSNNKPQIFPFHTDIHCHIVPGVDDGSPDVATSVELVKRMEAWGITRIFPSPHSTQDTFENTAETIAAPFAALKAEVEKAGVGIRIEPHHFEYRIDEFFLKKLEEKDVRTLPQKYILVENPFSQEPWNLDNFLFDLRLKGYAPILAHPERYGYYSNAHRGRYKQLHDTGLLFQVNMLSLSGFYGKQEKQTAEWMLEHGMVDFIGSDLHRMPQVESIDAYLASRDFRRHSKFFDTLKNDTL